MPSWAPTVRASRPLSVLAGNPAFTVTGGSAIFHGIDLLTLSPEDRSHEGLFLSFQYPVEIPGVSMVNFMRAAVNAKRKYFNEPPMGAADFLKLMPEARHSGSSQQARRAR